MKFSSSYLNPFHLMKNLWTNRALLGQLIVRELSQRYRGSFLGVFWTIINPLFMLIIYTFVFGVVLHAQWGTGQQTSTYEYAIILFAGLTPFNFFSEVATRSPSCIITMTTYVKKVVFPLELLPVMLVGVAFINSLISIVLLIFARLLVMHSVPISLLFLPLDYIPLIFLCLGAGWILASLGVYVRDIIQAMTLIVQVILFLSPVVYSEASLPARLQPYMGLNPMAIIIDSFRQSLIWNTPIQWLHWAIWTGILFVFAVLGYGWFMKTKKGFSDVL